MLNKDVISSIADLRFKHTQKELFFTIHWAPSKINGPRPKPAAEMYTDVGCLFLKPHKKKMVPRNTALYVMAPLLGAQSTDHVGASEFLTLPVPEHQEVPRVALGPGKAAV